MTQRNTKEHKGTEENRKEQLFLPFFFEHQPGKAEPNVGLAAKVLSENRIESPTNSQKSRLLKANKDKRRG